MTLEQINKLTVEQLFDPKVLEQVEKLAADSMFEFEAGMAQEFFFAVNDLMNKYKEDLKPKPQISERYFKILLSLFWKGFQAIGKGYKKEYITKHLAASLNNDIDVLAGIKRYLAVFEYNFVIDTQLRSELLFSLTNNEERLGKEMIELKTGEQAPSLIKNWIKDYVSSLPQGEMLPSSFDKINYLTGSANVRKLSVREKEILSKIIDIFGFLKAPMEKKPAAPIVPRVPVPVAKPQPVFSKPRPEPMPVKHGLSLEQLKKEIAPLDYKEIKREVDTPELPSHIATVVKTNLKTLNDIRMVDDMRQVEIGHLRQGELRKQIADIRNQITRLAAVNHLYPYQVVRAFEQSPLFKLYISHGSSRVVGQPSKDDLSQVEFEAMADLRKEIERM